MKEKFQTVLFILTVESLHFLLLTGVLCLLGFFMRASGETAVTFRELLWTGTVSFWLDGFGQIPLVGLAVTAAWSVWNYCADNRALAKRRAELEQETARRVEKRIAELRPELETAISKAYAETYAARRHELSVTANRLAAQRKDLDVEMHMVQMSWEGVHKEEEKITAWKSEVEALRRKAAEEKERKASIRQRIQWAADVLAEESPNLGLVLRHLKKAEKL